MTKPQVGNLILKKITFHVLTIYMIMCLASCIFLLVEIKKKKGGLFKKRRRKKKKLVYLLRSETTKYNYCNKLVNKLC